MKRFGTGWIIAIGLVVAIALAAVVAVATTGGDDASVPAGVVQVRPVSVAGDVLPTLPDAGDDPAIGMSAPVISGQSFDGSAISTDSSSARLLLFVAHWCPHCQREIPRLVEWAEQGDVPSGVEVTVVSTAVDADAPNYPPSSWLVDERVPWPVLVDDANRTGANAMGLSGFPYFVLLRADGTVAWRGSGEIDPAMLGEHIESLLAG